MKCQLAVLLVLLLLATDSFCLNLSRLLWMGSQSRVTTERQQEPLVVEVVRWRQPVCVAPADGVPFCLLALRKYQSEYERVSRTDDESYVKKISDESSKDEGEVRKQRSDEKVLLENGKLLVPEIVKSFSSEVLEPSEEEVVRRATEDVKLSSLTSETPEIEESKEKRTRERKHLIITSSGRSFDEGSPQIYVTKVLDSPVTATLIAQNCLPDIGVPLCENYRANSFSDITRSSSSEREVSLAQTEVSGSGEVKLAEKQKPVEAQNLRDQATSKPLEKVQPNSEEHDDEPVLQVIHDANRKPLNDISGMKSSVDSLTNFRKNVRNTLPSDLMKSMETDDSNIFKGVSQQRSEQSIVETIQEIVSNPHNSPEKPSVVESIVKPILLKPMRADTLDDFLKPLKDAFTSTTPTTTTQLTRSTTTRKSVIASDDQDTTWAWQMDESIEPVRRKTTERIFLREEEDDVSNRPGLLDILENPRDNVHQDDPTRSTEKLGLFDDLFANPIAPLDREKRDVSRRILGYTLSRPTSGPFLIHIPYDSQPLLVGKHVYAMDSPPKATKLFSNMRHNVIQDSIYVHKRPQHATIFWRLLGSTFTKPRSPGSYQVDDMFERQNENGSGSKNELIINNDVIEASRERNIVSRKSAIYPHTTKALVAQNLSTKITKRKFLQNQFLSDEEHCCDRFKGNSK